MIASPGDVKAERAIIREVIHEWNALHSAERRIVLLPVGWETHGSPEMGGRGQAFVNKQILEDADILVAAFWTKLGTPTGTSPSGTAEEISEHIAAGKPTLIYFSTAPVPYATVDRDQHDALMSFKASCQQNGLIAEYEDLAEFRDMLTRQLTSAIYREFPDEADLVGIFEAGLQGEPRRTLSAAASELLLEASKDPHGIIQNVQHLGGTVIKTNDRDFIRDNNPRSVATWRGAVEELRNERLIEDRGGKGQLLYVTKAGYEMADSLQGHSEAP
jgi:hypothetical protein